MCIIWSWCIMHGGRGVVWIALRWLNKADPEYTWTPEVPQGVCLNLRSQLSIGHLVTCLPWLSLEGNGQVKMKVESCRLPWYVSGNGAAELNVLDAETAGHLKNSLEGVC